MPEPSADPSTDRQIACFLARYDPAIIRLASEARNALRSRLPAAVELVYDNYNALVFGYGPSERASEAIFSLALYPRWINLFFLRGAELPDPANVLRGAGKQVRSIRLASAADLERSEIESLMAEALRRSSTPLPWTGTGGTVIKSISAKQRSRR